MNISEIVHSKTSPADVISWAGPEQAENVTSGKSTTAVVTKPYLSPASTSRTALLFIDIQRGINTTHGYFGTQRSTPAFEQNITAILSACRRYNINNSSSNNVSTPTPAPPIKIFHVYHRSTSPLSPLHPNSTIQPGGMAFMPCAEPTQGSELETIVSKSHSSAFCGTHLEELLRSRSSQEGPLEQLIVAGLVTDQCVGNSVRWARDLDVVVPQSLRPGSVGGADHRDQGPEEGKIVVASDATGCFAKGGFDAETVQRVHLASLDGEFAKVMTTEEVLGQLFGL